MAWFDQDHVLTMEGVVIWDAMTKPDIGDDGSKTYGLRIAVDPNHPEMADLRQLIQKGLRESKKPNVNPGNPGNDPISPIDTSKFPELPGMVAFSAGTRLGAPPVYNADGAELNAMQYSAMLYNGAKVKLLVHAYAYDTKQKGINFGLDGVQIVDATAPRLSIGAAGLGKDQVAKAFGGGGAPAAAQTTAAKPYTGYTQTGNSDAPPPPADDAPPAPPAEWPPQGWKENPNGPGWWYNVETKEQLKEAALRQRLGL